MPSQKELIEQIIKLESAQEKALLQGIRSDYVGILNTALTDLKVAYDNFHDLSRSQLYALERESLMVDEIVGALDNFVNAIVAPNMADDLLKAGMFGYSSEMWLTTMALRAKLPYLPQGNAYIQALMLHGVNQNNFASLNKANRIKTATRLEVILKQAFIRGDGFDKISKQVQEHMGMSMRHANTIARTEAGRLISIGNAENQRQLVQMGVKANKRWFSIKDKKTRHDHRLLDGQKRPIDQPYEVNGHYAMAPRLFGIASEDINCRCRSHTISEIQDVPENMWDSIKYERVPYQKYTEWEKGGQ
ncbi:gp4 [Listeria phage P40]|uniref:head morphogenesis n=1 Tax=Listeria phage P40 TaxID=560178 RepID=UPI00018198BB|nr:head morphogenesis [Listeria phage P40]ACI00364.1 gp4 [Listeria phage P40]